jgi:acetylornithine deacetylase
MSEEALRDLAARLVGFETVTGQEAPAQEFLAEYLEEAGFDVYTWEGDPNRLAAHPSFPDDPAEIAAAGRPNVGGVLEFGDPDAGPTLVLNGHIDVVPVEPESWSSPPFEATWLDGGSRLRGRGAADMKAALAACIIAAQDVASDAEGLDGRLVVESVVDEEAGGIGAAQSALENPYPFDRDAALVAEPTELHPVIAVEGTVMKRLGLTGRSAHAATRWQGESVIPHFIKIYEALMALEAERARTVTHPLYERFENPWPVNVGTVEAGAWASSVPARLTAGIRIGVAPGETVAEVEKAFEERLAEVVAEDPWLEAHPPRFERFSVQFEPASVDPEARIVQVLESALAAEDLGDNEPRGATYGADNRHYQAAGIPTVVFGPGTIGEAHFPDETIEWQTVTTARRVIAATATRFLEGA